MPVNGSGMLQPLETLILAVDLGTEVFDQLGNSSHRNNTVILWVADDVNNEAMSTIRIWADMGNQPFKLVVTIYDNSVAKDMFVFEGAVINALQHSIFTRESQDERVLGANNNLTAVVRPPVSRETSAKLLQIAFGEMQHHIMNGIQ
jgi:hypothetical protein